MPELYPTWLDKQKLFPSAIRDRVLTRVAHACQRCGVHEHRFIVQHFMTWPTGSWRYADTETGLWTNGGDRWSWDACLVRVDLFLVAPALPWSGEDAILDVYCFACVIHRTVEQVIAARPRTTTARGLF